MSANGTRTYSAWVPSISVAEDPAAAAEALAVAALAAEAARAARGDARHEHAVAGLTCLHARADRLDGADRLVAEDAPVGDLGDVALQDVQVGAADRDRVDADDRVGVVDRSPAWRRPPTPCSPGPWYTSAFIAAPFCRGPMLPERPASRQGAEVLRRRAVGPFADTLGLTPLPAAFFAVLVLMVAAYLTLVELGKGLVLQPSARGVRQRSADGHPPLRPAAPAR